MTCSLDVFIPVCSTFQLTKGKTGECVMWLTDWVSWALVQHMKNLSLLLQLLAWPSSSLCLMKRRWRMKSLCEENRKAAFFGSPSLWLNFAPRRHERWRRGKRNLRACQYLRVYVVRLRWRRRVAFSLTKVRPVGSKVHMRVMHTLNITSQLQTTMPAKNIGSLFTIRRDKPLRASPAHHLLLYIFYIPLT